MDFASSTSLGTAMQRVHFSADTGFQALVKKRVADYFAQSGRTPNADGRMVAKTIFWLALAAALWLAAVFAPSRALAWIAACCLGFTLAAIGFNVSHDAIHGAYSKHAWVNRVLGWTFQLMGASTFTWRTAHNVIHHTYTNIAGVDFDLDAGPWLRFRPGQRTFWFHRYQHIYCWALYPLISLVWLVEKDFVQLAQHKARTGRRASASEVTSVLAAKALHVLVFIGVPLMVSHADGVAVVDRRGRRRIPVDARRHRRDAVDGVSARARRRGSGHARPAHS
jgi:linoleoyl-CoA desaturase